MNSFHVRRSSVASMLAYSAADLCSISQFFFFTFFLNHLFITAMETVTFHLRKGGAHLISQCVMMDIELLLLLVLLLLLSSSSSLLLLHNAFFRITHCQSDHCLSYSYAKVCLFFHGCRIPQKVDCCKTPMYFQSFTLGNELCSSLSRMSVHDWSVDT
jgi:hypothetical protein